MLNLISEILGLPYVYEKLEGPAHHTFFIKEKGVYYCLEVKNCEGETYVVLKERYKKKGLLNKKYEVLNGQVGIVEFEGITELLNDNIELISEDKFEFLHEKLEKFKKLVE